MIDLTLARHSAHQLLESFLESAQCPPNTMNFYQLDGYVRAVASAPGEIPLSQWEPLIFNEATPEFADILQAEQIQNAIADVYNFHRAQVKTGCCDLPCSNAYASLQKDRMNIEQWARGFLQGYIVCESNWNELLDGLQTDQNGCKVDAKTIFDDFDAILTIVSVVADAKYAVEVGTDPDELGAIFERLPRSLIQWGHIGRSRS